MEISKEKLEKIYKCLPLPSEVLGDILNVPCNPHMRYDEEDGKMVVAFDNLIFNKEYIDGIAVGWKLGDDK